MGIPSYLWGDSRGGWRFHGNRRDNLLRSVLVAAGFLALYVALDWFSATFRGWPAGSTWYLPTGLAFAFLLTFGATYTPVYFLAELLTYWLTWKLPIRPLPIVLLAAIAPFCYGSAAAILRRSKWMDLWLRSTSAVAQLLLVSLLVPLLAGLTAGAWMAANGLVPWPHFGAFLLQRWISDVLGIVMLTPVLLVYGFPWLKARMGQPPAGQNLTETATWHALRGLTVRFDGELALWVGTTVLALWLAYSPAQSNSDNYHFYPLFVPLVWMAIRLELPGAMIGVLALNVASTFAFKMFHLPSAELVPSQLFALVLSSTGLLLGALIAERARQQESLLKQRNFTSAVLETAGALVVVLDREGRIVRFNQGCQRATGYAFDEVRDKHVWDVFLLAEEMEAAKSAFAAPNASNFPNSYENRWRTKDGGQRLIAWANTAMLDDTGAVEYVIGTGFDLTERRHAQQQLRLQSAALQSAANAVVITDCKGTVLWVNPAFTSLTGYTPQEVVGQNPHVLKSGQHDVQFYRTLWETVLSGQIWHGEIVNRRKDGSLYTEEMTITPVRDAGGSISHFIAIKQDVSERKRAQEELRQSEERFRLAFEKGPLGVILVGLDRRLFRVNQAMCEMLGYTEQQLLSLTITDITSPEERERDWQRSEKLLKGEISSQKWEKRYLKKNGETLEAEVTATLVRDAGGKPLYAMALIEDITERKRADLTLQESRARLAGIIASAMDAIISVDEDYRVVLFNEAAEKIFGWTAREALGQSLDRFIPERFRQSHREHIRTFAQTNSSPRAKGQGKSLIGLRSDGTEFPIDASISQLEVAGKKFFTAIVRDITERTRSMEALREANEFNHQMLTSAREGIVVYDRDLRFRIWNPFMEELSGVPARKVVGQQVLDVFPVLREWGVYANLEKAVAGQVVTSADYAYGPPFATRSGWFSVQYSPLRDAADQIVGVIEILRDVTERKHLEEQFRQAQKMEAVGRLAGGIAHDFNNMLGVIIGYSQLLQEKFGPEDPAGKQLAEVKKAADHAASLTRQLLAFSRKQVLHPRVLDPNTVVQDLDKMLRRMIGEDIELIIYQSTALGNVMADPGRLEQVLMNLAVNARDAMPQGGQLIIETTNVDLDETYAEGHQPTVPGRYVMLAVSDTGCGMDAETKAHIFEPFYTTKEAGQGTGLGLSTVYGVVKQSGGYIWVYSELGRGTTFKIYLPRVDEALAGDAPAQTTLLAETPASGTILLVEDEEPLRRLASSLLAHAGYAVLEANSGPDALELARQHAGRIDLLLTDVVMPGMSGREVAERLDLLRPAIKVVYMSGYTDDLIAQHGIMGPGMVLLEKPFTRESLLSKVREALGKKAAKDAVAGT